MGKFDNILCKITGSKFRSDISGKSIEIDCEGFSGDNMRNDMFFPAGIMSRPPNDSYGLFIPFGDSRSNGIIVAINNYKISIEHNKGEIIIYSTNNDGDEIKAKIKLDNDGNVEINGDSKRFVTFAELDSAMQTLKTDFNSHTHSGVSSGGSISGTPLVPIAIDISAAETQTIKTGG
jgi:hypothetical protein